MAYSFRIVTVANDLRQYAAMRQSFEAAGFVEGVARYTLHDNSAANTADPYEVLRAAPQSAGDAQYTILCHQDIRLDLGHGYAELVAALADLTNRHPAWALAGNAGVNAVGQNVLHLDEPTGRRRVAALPQAVGSLDENLLIFRHDAGPLASLGLGGFHFYGTDACLCAAYRGRGAYVIDFLVTHLSAGNPASEQFRDAQRRLIETWRPRVLVGLVGTTCTLLRFSRWRWLDRRLQGYRAGQALRRVGLGLVFVPGDRAHASRL